MLLNVSINQNMLALMRKVLKENEEKKNYKDLERTYNRISCKVSERKYIPLDDFFSFCLLSNTKLSDYQKILDDFISREIEIENIIDKLNFQTSEGSPICESDVFFVAVSLAIRYLSACAPKRNRDILLGSCFRDKTRKDVVKHFYLAYNNYGYIINKSAYIKRINLLKMVIDFINRMNLKDDGSYLNAYEINCYQYAFKYV